MALVLDQVIPLGRSFDEYARMFALTAGDLAGNIVGIGDGPASFNAEGTRAGYRITSIDPIYAFSGEEIKQRFYHIIDSTMDQICTTSDAWVWSYHRSPEALRERRERILHTFLADYEAGKQAGRYIEAELPRLPFDDQSFSLGVCSHLLFLYSAHFDYQFHRAALAEMLRVCREVRIFPLLDLSLQRSQHLEPIIAEFSAMGYAASVQRIDYEFQRGGNQMLILQ